jgi:hypothetical protein
MATMTTERIDRNRGAAAVTHASHPVSIGSRRWGRGIAGFVGLFLLVDGGARLIGVAQYVEGTVEFGFPEGYAAAIGLTLVLSTVLYLIPRTAVLGAVLLTGYLGGAAATHIQREDPWFLFAVLFAVLAWAGLYLRDPRIRDLLPLRRTL